MVRMRPFGDSFHVDSVKLRERHDFHVIWYKIYLPTVAKSDILVEPKRKELDMLIEITGHVVMFFLMWFVLFVYSLVQYGINGFTYHLKESWLSILVVAVVYFVVKISLWSILA